MILTTTEAKEIGEALIDAAQKSIEDNTDQSVIVLKNHTAIALPSDLMTDDWEHVAYITRS